MKFKAAVDIGSGFSTWTDTIEGDTLEELLQAIKSYSPYEDSYLCILGSTQEPPLVWEAIEECWETYVVPAIEKLELDKKIKLVENNIAKEEAWFIELESTKAFKQNYLELQRSVLKHLKEQQ